MKSPGETIDLLNPKLFECKRTCAKTRKTKPRIAKTKDASIKQNKSVEASGKPKCHQHKPSQTSTQIDNLNETERDQAWQQKEQTNEQQTHTHTQNKFPGTTNPHHPICLGGSTSHKCLETCFFVWGVL